jgi:AcrR family transcriptional regulator
MARKVDPEAHAVRREAFVDAALRVIQAKGYEQMSIKDVLDELNASKGALYHYFDSKVALLEAVVEQMVDVVIAAQEPMVADPDRSALEKLAGVFGGIASWKTDRDEQIVALMRVWISDENAIVREKVRERTVLRLTPLLTRVLRQGKAEGVFTVSSPEHSAGVLVSAVLGANEVGTRLYIARQAGAVTFEDVQRTIAAYTEAFERILGMDAGRWPIVDDATLRHWFG